MLKIADRLPWYLEILFWSLSFYCVSIISWLEIKNEDYLSQLERAKRIKAFLWEVGVGIHVLLIIALVFKLMPGSNKYLPYTIGIVEVIAIFLIIYKGVREFVDYNGFYMFTSIIAASVFWGALIGVFFK